jgi:uncharacterized protein (TIGR03086 family)
MNMAEPDNAVDLGPAARRLADLVTNVKDDALDRPTPCPAYTLGDLIEHVGGLALAFAAAGRKERNAYTEMGGAGDASRLGAGWRERIPRDLAALAQTWAEPGAWTGMTRIAGDDSPAGVVGLVLADELAVHGWDVARATGQAYACEPDILEAALKFLQMFASPDAPAGPEVTFGPARILLDEAPLLDRVVGMAGRDPGWSAR